MSDLVLLSVGFVVFFISVYGVVMVSGLTLMKKQIREEPELGRNLNAGDLDGLPTNIEY